MSDGVPVRCCYYQSKTTATPQSKTTATTNTINTVRLGLGKGKAAANHKESTCTPWLSGCNYTFLINEYDNISICKVYAIFESIP